MRSNHPEPNPVLPSTTKTTTCTGLEICLFTILKLRSDWKALLQSFHQCHFLYQGDSIHGIYGGTTGGAIQNVAFHYKKKQGCRKHFRAEGRIAGKGHPGRRTRIVGIEGANRAKKALCHVLLL